MKKYTFFLQHRLAIILIFTIFLFQGSLAQKVLTHTSKAVKDSISIKEAKSSKNGKLVTRIALTGANDVTTIKGPTTNLMIYNTATAGVSPNNVYPGYYHNVGTTEKPNWKRIDVTVSEAVKNKQP